jgi:hypothetical protein
MFGNHANGSLSSKLSNSSVNSNNNCYYSANLRTKCTKCALWQNLYKIFEFLAKGRLNELGLDLSMRLGGNQALNSLIEKFEKLVNLINQVNQNDIVKNPIDPCDSANWTWDFKCPKHYKLLKLKLKLINQTEQLIKLATCPVANGLVGTSLAERSCSLCAELADQKSALSKYLYINEILASKLALYVSFTRPVLERVFDKFTSFRLKNSHEINVQSDFYLFLREPFVSSRSNSTQNEQQTVINSIEYCANKIYSLLDLLVYDNLKVSIDRPIKEFNAMLNLPTSGTVGAESNNLKNKSSKDIKEKPNNSIIKDSNHYQVVSGLANKEYNCENEAIKCMSDRLVVFCFNKTCLVNIRLLFFLLE